MILFLLLALQDIQLINVHTCFSVSDISLSVLWYQEHYDATVSYQDSNRATIEIGTKRILLEALGNEANHNHVTFRVSTVKDLPCSLIEIDKYTNGSHYFYRTDPDGNTIEWEWVCSSEAILTQSTLSNDPIDW